MKPEYENKILQRYVSSKPNHVICIDISYFVNDKCYFVGIDLATRLIVGHFFKTSAIQVNDIVNCLSSILKARKFVNKVEIVHSDKESLFKNEIYWNFLKLNDIEISHGSSKSFNNQVVERLHRTLKYNVRKSLINQLGESNKKLIFKRVSGDVLKQTLSTEITKYNNTPHSSNYKLSPNSMDEAFHAYSRENEPIEGVLVENSKIDNEITKLRRNVAKRYAGNWESFFIDWRKDQAIKDERLFNNNLELQRKVDLLQQELSYISEQTKIQELDRHKRELNKIKRETALKLPLRDVISNEEFVRIIKIEKRKSYSGCRRRLALVLLYLTGLRVSNLLILSLRHVKSLFKEGKMVIPLIKKGNDRHLIELSVKGLSLFQEHEKDFKTLCKDKKLTNYVFTTEFNINKAISRESFDRELNSILKKASLDFGKHLRTHSFRATFITDLLKSTPIDDVKEFIGHRDIETTLTYKRSRLSEEKIKEVLIHLDKTRS